MNYIKNFDDFLNEDRKPYDFKPKIKPKKKKVEKEPTYGEFYIVNKSAEVNPDGRLLFFDQETDSFINELDLATMYLTKETAEKVLERVFKLFPGNDVKVVDKDVASKLRWSKRR